MKMFAGSFSFSISAVAFLAATVVAVDLQPSNSNPDTASTFMAMDYLMSTGNPARAFETNGDNLRNFLLNPNRNPAVDSIAIIDLRQNDQYNLGYIRSSIRLAMADGAQGSYVAEMANGNIAPQLAQPQVQQARYVVFYCQLGASRSPALAKGYFHHVIMQNIPGFRQDQRVVLLAHGFQRFQEDPRNAPMIATRPNLVSMERIQPDEPDSPSNDPFRHDRPNMTTMSGIQPAEAESPSDMVGSSGSNEGSFSDWQQKRNVSPKKIAKRFTA